MSFDNSVKIVQCLEQTRGGAVIPDGSFHSSSLLGVIQYECVCRFSSFPQGMLQWDVVGCGGGGAGRETCKIYCIARKFIKQKIST